MDDRLNNLRKEMTEAKVKQEVRWLVEKLSETLWSELDRLSLPDSDRDSALDVFTKSAKGHSFKPDTPSEAWIQAKPGALVVGDYVRVKKDAFSQQPAATHNGKEGRIVALRYGDIYVRYNTAAASPGINSVKHVAASLEKRL